MKLFNHENGDGELFEIDDELRQQLGDMSNTDELVDVMDAVGDNRDAVIDAIETIAILQNNGIFDILQQFSAIDIDAALDSPQRIGPLQATKQLRDPDVQRGIGVLVQLLKALGQEADSTPD
jgi:uncharacterized protein YjgD (DUF1641 family)